MPAWFLGINVKTSSQIFGCFETRNVERTNEIEKNGPKMSQIPLCDMNNLSPYPVSLPLLDSHIFLHFLGFASLRESRTQQFQGPIVSLSSAMAEYGVLRNGANLGSNRR